MRSVLKQELRGELGTFGLEYLLQAVDKPPLVGYAGLRVLKDRGLVHMLSSDCLQVSGVVTVRGWSSQING